MLYCQSCAWWRWINTESLQHCSSSCTKVDPCSQIPTQEGTLCIYIGLVQSGPGTLCEESRVVAVIFFQWTEKEAYLVTINIKYYMKEKWKTNREGAEEFMLFWKWINKYFIHCIQIKYSRLHNAVCYDASWSVVLHGRCPLCCDSLETLLHGELDLDQQNVPCIFLFWLYFWHSGNIPLVQAQ